MSETSVPAVPAGNTFRLYAEASGDFNTNAIGSIQTGLAITNTSTNIATVTLELFRLDGSYTGQTGTLSIPANGQVATFLNRIPGTAVDSGTRQFVPLPECSWFHYQSYRSSR